MKIEQIYSTVNSLANNMTKGQHNVVDYTSFVNFGEYVLSQTDNKEKWYGLLVDRIGKTIFAIDLYEPQNRNVLVDSFTFGSILQKISYSLKDSESNSSWGTPLNPYTITQKDGIKQKFFNQKLPTFAYTDVIPDYQLESAFLSASAMGGFINGLYTRMRNSLALSIETMNSTAINAFAHKIALETMSNAKPINRMRYRNLLGEYNTKHASNKLTTVNDALNSSEFLEFCCIEMGLAIPKLSKLTAMYNDGTVERFTNENDLVVEMHNKFTEHFNVKLKSNVYHDSLVKLPNYTDVPYWTNEYDDMNITLVNDDDEYAIKNCICIMRDKDAVVSTLEREKETAFNDVINDRTVIKMSCDRRYIVDTSENGIVFYLEYAEKTITFAKGTGTGTMASVTTDNNYYILPDCTFTPPTDKTFKGWQISEGGVAHILDVGTTISVPTNATLTAIYE